MTVMQSSSLLQRRLIVLSLLLFTTYTKIADGFQMRPIEQVSGRLCRSRTIATRTTLMLSSSDAASDVVDSKALRKRRLYSFSEARKIARGHGFSTKQEFLDYECPGAYQLPKNPQDVWSSEWVGWDDWLGIPWDFETARQLAHDKLSVTTQEEYEDFFRNKNKNLSEDDSLHRMPFRPDLFYKKQWQGWDDFL